MRYHILKIYINSYYIKQRLRRNFPVRRDNRQDIRKTWLPSGSLAPQEIVPAPMIAPDPTGTAKDRTG